MKTQNLIVKKCEYCNNDFEVGKSQENKRFCTRRCYDVDRKEKAIKICPICLKQFSSGHKPAIFCSNKCKVDSRKDRIECICEYCGIEFERIRSEVVKNNKHYCSNECRKNDMYWSLKDILILRDNYKIITNEEIKALLSEDRSIKAIRSKAKVLHLTTSREWTDEEIQVLVDNYSSVAMSDVQKLLPRRSPSSILGKARTLGLLSHFYIQSNYSDDDLAYLKENYLDESNESLALKLNRTPYAIEQKLYNLGLSRPLEINNYKTLSFYIRARIRPWRDEILRKNNYTCSLTGRYRNVVIHHCKGFNLLILETIDSLNFPVYENIESYTQDDLDYFLNEFLLLQDFYGEYICISEDIHKLFHFKYGYGNNTMEQWNEFSHFYKTNAA